MTKQELQDFINHNDIEYYNDGNSCFIYVPFSLIEAFIKLIGSEYASKKLVLPFNINKTSYKYYMDYICEDHKINPSEVFAETDD